MKDEINKIIQSISDFYKLDNALKYYLDRHKAQILLDYITNLQEENERLHNIIKEVRYFVVTHKLYNFKYDDEELFEIVTDKKIKDELLQILDKGE